MNLFWKAKLLFSVTVCFEFSKQDFHIQNCTWAHSSKAEQPLLLGSTDPRLLTFSVTYSTAIVSESLSRSLNFENDILPFRAIVSLHCKVRELIFILIRLALFSKILFKIIILRNIYIKILLLSRFSHFCKKIRL